MASNAPMNKLHPDAEKIMALGGPAQVSRILRFEKFGTQRVANWMKRGIPLRIRVDYPYLFGAPSPQSAPRSEDKKP